MSVCRGENINSHMINAQVADELLTIKGVEASFVAGRNELGQTVVSARSLGDINVQVILEKFGGGGHMHTAGAVSYTHLDVYKRQAGNSAKNRSSNDRK